MFAHLLSALQTKQDNDQIITRRQFTRRETDRCVSVINGHTYPVENWSMGGLLVYGDSRLFGIDNEMDVTLKFKLRNEVINVLHKARVVRKSREKIAFEFFPLPKDVKRKLQNVVDDVVTGNFVDSQLT